MTIVESPKTRKKLKLYLRKKQLQKDRHKDFTGEEIVFGNNFNKFKINQYFLFKFMLICGLFHSYRINQIHDGV